MPRGDRRAAVVNSERKGADKIETDRSSPAYNQMCATSTYLQQKSAHSLSPPSPITSPPIGKDFEWKGDRSQPNRRSNSRDTPNDSIPDQGEVWRYMDLKTGDCVLLDSGVSNEHYVALVNSVKPSSDRRKPGSFIAQWYYKPKDIEKEVRESIEGGVLENEVFLSSHKDKNCLDAVVGSCYIVSPSEYETIRFEIDRGCREKGKTYFVCRYMYYPNRATTKNALVPIQDLPNFGEFRIRIGNEYQATIPDLMDETQSTWLPHLRTCLLSEKAGGEKESHSKRSCPTIKHIPIQVWCPDVLKLQAGNILHYRGLVDLIRFSVGNIVKMFHKGTGSMGHVRCVVLRYYALQATIEVCTSRGNIRKALKSESCSPLTDDIALQYFYLSRFNISLAVKMCTELLWESQPFERDAFKKELGLFALSTRNSDHISSKRHPSSTAAANENLLGRSEVSCLGVRKR